MNRILLFFVIVTCACPTSCTSTYSEQEAADRNKQELIVGKWACKRPGTYSGYDLYVFRADGTGLAGHYYNPDANPSPSLPNPRSAWFRYNIAGGKIAFCYTPEDTHPMRPGAVCGEYDDTLIFYDFTVDAETLYIDTGVLHPLARVSKWSDVGLPDDLLPE